MVASHNHSTTTTTSTVPWLADSGCNSHVTADFNQFTHATEYVGDDQIVVGSGQSLPITHSGCGILKTPSSSIRLLELLRVPNISSNLLSVNRLCTDNNCLFIFYSDFFIIQDKSSGRIIFQGPNIDGLYPLHPSGFSPSSPVAHVGTRTTSLA